ncbi:MAG: spore maturation protein A [Ruminococcaceae bacterium]|nr:spore maturation protein A [Oscillospiraceae bacterium]
MLSVILGILLVLGIVFGCINGCIDTVLNDMMSSSKSALELTVNMGCMIALWSGVMNVAKACKLTDALAKLLSPVIRLVFKKLDKGSDAEKYLALNITANLLGLSNAATPSGISAAKELVKEDKKNLTDNTTMLLVINSASLQLIPTTVAAIRSGAGCKSAFDIVPAVWIASLLSLLLGIFLCKLKIRR